MNKYGKFAILMAIIVGSLGFLAYSGIQGSTTYYKTIAELRQMGPGLVIALQEVLAAS